MLSCVYCPHSCFLCSKQNLFFPQRRMDSFYSHLAPWSFQWNLWKLADDSRSSCCQSFRQGNGWKPFNFSLLLWPNFRLPLFLYFAEHVDSWSIAVTLPYLVLYSFGIFVFVTFWSSFVLYVTCWFCDSLEVTWRLKNVNKHYCSPLANLWLSYSDLEMGTQI